MSGKWNEVWDSGACRGAGEVDRRTRARSANDVPEGDGGEDMFTRAGVAAE